MEMIFCPNCHKLTGYKRHLGFGTLFAVLLTAGVWLLAIPFYPKRCITCGLTKSASIPWYRTWRLVGAAFMVLLGFGLFVFVIIGSVGDEHLDQPAQIIKGPKYNEVIEPLPSHPAITIRQPNLAFQLTVSSICEVDFRNSVVSSGGSTVLLRDGKYERKEKAVQEETVELKQNYCFDGGIRGLIILDWTGCGANCHGEGIVQLFELRSGHPVIAQELSFDENALGTQAQFDPRTRTLTITGRSADDSADCCPKSLDVVTYAWRGRKFAEQRFKRIPVPNDAISTRL